MIEEKILKIFNWDLNNLTPYDFIEAYKQMGLLFPQDTIQRKSKEPIWISDLNPKGVGKKIRNLHKLLRAFGEISNLVPEFYSIKSSRVASICIFTARKMLGIEPFWSEEMRHLTTYTQEDV